MYKLLIILILISCSKEKSYEQNCGKITSKDAIRKTITVNEVPYHVGLVKFNMFEIGDYYCTE